MPLHRNYEFDLNRFGLLEQLLSQKHLDKDFEKVLNSKSTDPLLRDYFWLLKQRQGIEDSYFNNSSDQQKKKLIQELSQTQEKMDEFFKKMEKNSPVLAKVCKAHLLITSNMTHDGVWIMRAVDADASYKENARPLLEDLKQLNLGIGYRFEAELQIEEEQKRVSYLRAAQVNDRFAKGLFGMEYLNYLVSNAQSTQPYDYFSPPWVEPLDLFQEALREQDPEAVAKALAFFDNVCNVINDLDPKRLAKNVDYQLRLKRDAGVLEPGQIILGITPEVVSYTFLDDNNKEITGTFEQDFPDHFLSEEYFSERKNIWLPLIKNKIIAINPTLPPPFKQEHYDSKLLTVLGCAEKIAEDKKLEKMIGSIKKAVANREYDRIPSKVKAMRAYISSDYALKKQEALSTALQVQAQASSPKSHTMTTKLEKLYELYEREIHRIEKSKPSDDEVISLRELRLFQQKIHALNRLKDNTHIISEIKKHINKAENRLKKGHYSSAFKKEAKRLYQELQAGLNSQTINRKKQHKSVFMTMKEKLGRMKGHRDTPSTHGLTK